MRTTNRLRILLMALACISLVAGVGQAAPVTYSGYFNDTGNTALRGSYPATPPDPAPLEPPLFGDDWEIANNVALYNLTVPLSGTVTFQSVGFVAGGADPYFTLFDGTIATATAATFVMSNYDIAFSTGGDFTLAKYLNAGSYVVAMGVFANMSFAENYGSGFLSDAFTALGGPFYLGNYYYELAITLPDEEEPPIPEPATLLLLGSGLLGLTKLRGRSRH